MLFLKYFVNSVSLVLVLFQFCAIYGNNEGITYSENGHMSQFVNLFGGDDSENAHTNEALNNHQTQHPNPNAVNQRTGQSSPQLPPLGPLPKHQGFQGFGKSADILQQQQGPNIGAPVPIPGSGEALGLGEVGDFAGNQISSLGELGEMIMRSANAVSGAAEIAGSSTSLLKNVITSMLQGAEHLNVQIETMQRVSNELTKQLQNPIAGIQPLLESQVELATTLTKSVDSLIEDVNTIQTTILGFMYYIPYLIGTIIGSCVISIILLVVICCNIRSCGPPCGKGVGAHDSNSNSMRISVPRHHISNGANHRYKI